MTNFILSNWELIYLVVIILVFFGPLFIQDLKDMNSDKEDFSDTWNVERISSGELSFSSREDLELKYGKARVFAALAREGIEK